MQIGAVPGEERAGQKAGEDRFGLTEAANPQHLAERGENDAELKLPSRDIQPRT